MGQCLSGRWGRGDLTVSHTPPQDKEQGFYIFSSRKLNIYIYIFHTYTHVCIYIYIYIWQWPGILALWLLNEEIAFSSLKSNQHKMCLGVSIICAPWDAPGALGMGSEWECTGGGRNHWVQAAPLWADPLGLPWWFALPSSPTFPGIRETRRDGKASIVLKQTQLSNTSYNTSDFFLN